MLIGKGLFGKDKNPFSKLSSKLKSKDVSKLDIFEGSIENDNDLPKIQTVLSRVKGEVVFSKGDRMSSAFVLLDNDIHCLLLVKAGAEDLNYLRLKRMIEDAGSQIDSVMFIRNHMIASIYKNVFDKSEVSVSNDSLANIENMLDVAIDKKAANINILYSPSAYMTITFKINKMLWQYESIDAEVGLKMLKAFYRRVSEQDKSNAEFSINEELNCSYNYSKTNNGLTRIFNLRWASMPSTTGGHDVTIRLNETGRPLIPLDELGYDKQTLSFFDDVTDKESGLMLWVGATDSGKTTTNASFAQKMLAKSAYTKKLVTAEDPVELYIPTAHHHSIYSNKSDVDPWHTMIKSFKRQAPDIVFVGEIRDSIVAKACIQEALAGHFTLSTLHAISWGEALNRLIIEMNIDPHTLCMPGLLRGIVSQKLVPKVCTHCSLSYEESKESFDKKYQHIIQEMFTDDEIENLNLTNLNGDCEYCADTKGRIGIQPIYEIYKPNDYISKYIIAGDFTGAKKAWDTQSNEPGVNGITFLQRAKLLAIKGSLCPLWMVQKLVEKS